MDKWPLTLFFALTCQPLLAPSAEGYERVSKTFNFRQSVVWESAGKEVAVSNTQRVTLTWYSPAFGLEVNYSGEALGAKVEGVGQVFLALAHSDSPPIAAACGVPSPDLTSAKQAEAWFAELEAAFQFQCRGSAETAPIIVTLSDLANPMTAAAFGRGGLPPGLRLVEYEIERTTDEPTFGAIPSMPWLSDSRYRAVQVWNGSRVIGSLSLSTATFARHLVP